MLRPLVAGDADALVEAINDFEVSRWLTHVPYPYTPSDADEFIHAIGPQMGALWAIDHGDTFCGVISIGKELGYWLAKSAWGKGFITEVGDAVVDAWFGNPDAADLKSSHFVENTRSAHALQKLGFVDIGGHVHHSIAQNADVPGRKMHLTRDRWQDRRRFRIETDRLILRELHPEDWRDLQPIGGHPRVAPMMMSCLSPWPEADVKAWIARARFRGRPGFTLAACTRDGKMIGAVGLGGKPLSTLWMIDPRESGQGYATEAVGAFFDACFALFDLGEVVSDHFVDNPASARVHEKIGFERIGGGMGRSRARLEPAPITRYRLTRSLRDAKK
ncbi:hypothetical protein KIN_40080 [Litoreibacter roseus]|uniref:N-acetyltransferase domain-containing protein n=1 Tax=Litoreibacter roseus TaxID=2601869 RepID=A0A6N6JLC6_9RHOB|nr:hypothetical protein KIN_40080 [Litoreibacter roseus]